MMADVHLHSNQVSNVCWHLLNLSVVELFDVLHGPHIVVCHEIDGNTLSTKSAASTNPMEVVLHVCRKVIVDDERHLLHIDSASEQIGRNEHSGGTRAKLTHHQIALFLVKISMHAGHCEVAFHQLVLQEVDLASCVTVNDGLSDGQCLVKVTESVHFPFLFLNCHIELPDTFQGQFILLHQNAHGISHKLGGHVQDLWCHGGREKTYLNIWRKALENVVDLVLETT
mmetsp:Transcript_20120/g.44381  ORF Transcript_20120/g.44381 Transcript_20120/m.44381 type:complete len:227 (+) Transcript_20120:61-741(+)